MNDSSPVLVTGGAGFIGSNFILDWLERDGSPILNLDKLTYAGNLQNLVSVEGKPAYSFEQGDICDRPLVDALLRRHQPRAIVHFAAESHVDRSLVGPEAFVQTNIFGTFCLLEAARAYLAELPAEERAGFRFLHVSTDEVYGTLGPGDAAFEETTAYAPNSPYAASKAASDHLVRSYVHSYGFPAITSNCSNNYGPYQFPEKLLPLMIANAAAGKRLPVYGDGRQIRDWLYVGDHCSALRLILERGKIGETYNIGGHNEQANLDTVHLLCSLLDEMLPGSPHVPHSNLISFVTDRPGHDRRYAINAGKIERELGWKPAETFSSGLRRTVKWYLEHQDWVQQVTSGAYRQWIDTNYAGRGEARR
ncbi:MAG TPA: dTDP-glucose 4,6-dehydratase [Acidobacteriaceae bacterium]|nr:dTDP-glucose 4,6-dehydratase [Acidobacteriaceae bacterium]